MTQTLTIPGQQSPFAVGVADPAARPARQWALDALRVAAIAGVVAIHVIGLLVSNDGWQGTKRWWAAVTVDVGSVWVVPVFVMISGALVLAPRAHAGGPAAFYRRRFVRILPALVAWHLVYLFVVRIGLRGQRPHLGAVATMVVDMKLYTGLYFLWLIAGLYLVAPGLAAFLHGAGRRRALATAAVATSWTLITYVCAAVASTRPVSLNAWTQWLPYVGYFVAGWALHRVFLNRRGIVAAAVVTVVVLAGCIWQYGHRQHLPLLQALTPNGYLSASTVVAATCLFLAAVGAGARVTPAPWLANLLERLSDASFGVFLVHLLILEAIRMSVPAVARASSLWVLVAAYAVVLVSSFLVSIGASRVPYLRTVF